MPYKLISLVFLLFFLIINKAYSADEFILPVKKPSIFKKIEKNITSKTTTNLPQKKPVLQSNASEQNIVKEKKEIKKKITPEKEVVKVDTDFLYPKKKPVTYKTTSKEAKKSTILNSKDFAKAKETMKFIKSRKWNSAIKSAEKVKDRDFRTLIEWMYLKTTGNSATFNDYKKFIDRNSDYPRINRIKYLAEQKIYLKNSSPTSIIHWFVKNPPFGGLG